MTLFTTHAGLVFLLKGSKDGHVENIIALKCGEKQSVASLSTKKYTKISGSMYWAGY